MKIIGIAIIIMFICIVSSILITIFGKVFGLKKKKRNLISDALMVSALLISTTIAFGTL